MKLKVFLTLVLISISGMLQGSHMMGGDMAYVSLGNNKYRIILHIYRDCRGISFNNPTFGVFAGTAGGMGCGKYNLSPTRTSITDITPRCSTGNKPCNPANVYGTGEGVEQHTYEDTVDFSSSPLSNFVNNSSCCEVTFFVGQCCRTGAITTGPAGNDFFISCMLNICNLKKTASPRNSSPAYLRPPIAFGCCNQTVGVDNACIDTLEFDSLSFRLVPGIQNLPNSAVNYSSPFSYNYPMTPFCTPPGSVSCKPNPSSKPPKGFNFDTLTGEVLFTPTKCDEAGIIVSESREYRRDTGTGQMLLIGKTMRDMMFIIKDDCGYNKAPTIKLPSGELTACEGDRFCFEVQGLDETFTPYQTIPDTVSINIRGMEKGMKMTILDPSQRERIARFCWTPPMGYAGKSYTFSVEVSDKQCYKPAIVQRPVRIKVNKKYGMSNSYSIDSCNKLSVASTLDTILKPAYVSYFALDSNNNLLKSFSSKPGVKALLNVNYEGRGFLKTEAFHKGFCTYQLDTVHFPRSIFVFLPKDTALCFQDTWGIRSTVKYNSGAVKYAWSTSGQDTFSHLKSSKVQASAILYVTDVAGCMAYAEISIDRVKSPLITPIMDALICSQHVVYLSAKPNANYYYYWNGNYGSYSLKADTAGRYYLRVRNPLSGCDAFDTVDVFALSKSGIELGPDQMKCQADTFKLFNLQNTSGKLNYKWMDSANNTLSIADTFNYFLNARNKYVSLELSSELNTNCKFSDFLKLSIPERPVLRHTDIQQCYTGVDLPDDSLNLLKTKYPDILVSSDNPKSLLKILSGKYTYQLSTLPDSVYSERITLNLNYATKCSVSSNYYVNILPRPEPKFRALFLPQSLKCMDLDTAFVNIPDRNDYSIYWSCIAAPSAVIRQYCVKPGAGVNGKQKFIFCFDGGSSYLGNYKFSARVVNDSTGCENTVSVSYTILKTVNSISHAQKEIRVYPNPIAAGGLLTLPENSMEVELWDLRGVKLCAMVGSEAGFIVPAWISPGQYAVKFRIGDRTQLLKLSVQD